MYKYIIGILILCGLIGTWFIHSEIYRAEAIEQELISFSIEEGESVYALSEKLEQAGVIRHSALFRKYLSWKNLDIKVQAGDFTVQDPITLARVADALKKPSFAEREVTIIPGWTLRDIAEYFEQQGLATKKETYALLGEPAKVHRGTAGELEGRPIFEDKPKNISYEGYLSPNTFRVFANASLEDVIDKLLDHRESQFTEQMYADINASGRTVFDVFTIASLLEKEVRGEKNKKLVSDLFWRRLDNGWPLQADSTVHYIVGTDGSVFTSAKDRDKDSPWNTYKYPGLPKGPIGTPSFESIMAAIYPDKNDYWYFLTTLDTGEVKYATTLEGHNTNVQKYLR